MQRPGRITWIILILLAGIIKVFSWYPHAVERYYSQGLYPFISGTQRILLGWIPFSIGDLFYAAVTIYLVYSGVVFVRKILRRQPAKALLVVTAKKILFAVLLVYVVFNTLWGLNYNRQPMMQSLGMSAEQYSTGNLNTIVDVLIKELNGFDVSLCSLRLPLRKKKFLFHEVRSAYEQLKTDRPAFTYRYPSIKPSMFSYAGNYLGFTGYYNPFTGEAQTNTTVPVFIQPFTTCHEFGHQLGYAKENEANFAGFLAARSSKNPAFRYSVYFEMYTYAIRELYVRDSVQANKLRKMISPQVKRDIFSVRKFYRKYESPVEPFIRALYGNYLRANQQPTGMSSYNEVIAMLLGYYRKYGHI